MGVLYLPAFGRDSISCRLSPMSVLSRLPCESLVAVRLDGMSGGVMGVGRGYSRLGCFRVGYLLSLMRRRLVVLWLS